MTPRSIWQKVGTEGRTSGLVVFVAMRGVLSYSISPVGAGRARSLSQLAKPIVPGALCVRSEDQALARRRFADVTNTVTPMAGGPTR